MKTTLVSKIYFPFKNIISYKSSKWFIYSVIVGVLAGVGVIVLYALIDVFSWLFLNHISGFPVTHPTNEHPIFQEIHREFNRMLFVLVATLGGFLSGFFSYLWAPETAGGGTGVVLHQYHHNKPIALRVPFVKILVSAFTLGTGGAAGREGPAAQMGAGFGYWVGKWLGLTEREANILKLCGLAAGIGAVFRSPMGAAIFAAEVAYRDAEIEHEVLLPATVASITAYSVFSSVFGWVHMFSTPNMVFNNPFSLIPYTLLAIVCAGSGILFINVFTTTEDLFSNMRAPLYVRTAVGGFLVGIIGSVYPEFAGMGYGIMQQAFLCTLPFYMILIIAFVRMFTTSLTLGSGNSGGMFAPTLIIGAALGSGFGSFFHMVFPQIVQNPGAFAVVAMAGFFVAIFKTPVSIIIMVAEITGNYDLLIPSMWVVALAFLFTTRYTIEKSQVKDRASSPLHRFEYMRDVLRTIFVRDVMTRDFEWVRVYTPLRDIYKILSETHHTEVLVFDDDDNLVGIVTMHVLKTILGESELAEIVVASDVANIDLVTTTEDEDLNHLMHKIGFREINTVPVVDRSNPRKVIGIVRRRDIIKAFNEAIDEMDRLRKSQ